MEKMARFNPHNLAKTLQDVDINHGFQRRRATKPEYAVVVAIDFGTSFSGFAFSLNHKDGSEEVYMNREWGMEQGYSTFKTPTCLLLNQRQEFTKFGFEASERYAELEDAKERSFYYFDHFKMMLYGSEVSWRNLAQSKNHSSRSVLFELLKSYSETSWAYGFFIFPIY